MKPKEIVIADDSDLVRRGIRQMLANHDEFRIVAEARDGQEAADKVLLHRPDLAILDLRMPKLTGIDATRIIRRTTTDIPILMLTAHAEPQYLFQAVRAGAAGYVLKEASEEQLIAQIHSVLEGEPVLDPHLVRDFMLKAATLAPTKPQYSPPPHDLLTSRELEILVAVAQGHTNHHIAQDLHISSHTVKGHVEAIIKKLKASDRTQAAVRATELGLVPQSAFVNP